MLSAVSTFAIWNGVSPQEITEDATHDGSLGGIDDQPPIFALVVAEEVLVVEAVLAV